MKVSGDRVHPFVGWVVDQVQRGDLTPLEGEDRIREQGLPEDQVQMYLEGVEEAIKAQ